MLVYRFNSTAKTIIPLASLSSYFAKNVLKIIDEKNVMTDILNSGFAKDIKVYIGNEDEKEEIKELRRRITETEKQIFRIAEEGTVKDTVSGGMGGIQHFVVEGMPVPELSRKRLLLNKRKSMLIKKENELLELTNQVEQYISSIEKSELRTIFRLYYIDGMTWTQVAHRMNAMHPKRKIAYNEKNLQKRNERFFAENE